MSDFGSVSSELWNEARDLLPSSRELEKETIEVRIEAAKVCALLAIGQELNAFNLGETVLSDVLLDVLKNRRPLV